MTSADRIEQIKSYVNWWRQALDKSVETRERLLYFKSIGITMSDITGADLLKERIGQEEQAISSWERGLKHAEALLERALNGEIV